MKNMLRVLVVWYLLGHGFLALGEDQALGSLSQGESQTTPDPSQFSPEVLTDFMKELTEHKAIHRTGRADEKIHEKYARILNDRIKVFEQVLAFLEERLKQYDEKQTGEIRKIVKVFESMRPQQAAQVLEALPPDIQVLVFDFMKEGKLGAILACMQPKNASRVAEILTRASVEVHKASIDPSKSLKNIEQFLPVRQKL